MRGGGGSTWGVILSMTLKSYLNPVGGFTYLAVADFANNACLSGITSLKTTFANVISVSTTLSNKFGGVYSISSGYQADEAKNCNGYWIGNGMYVFLGPSSDPEIKQFIAKMPS
jgi:hypothetical protein